MAWLPSVVFCWQLEPVWGCELLLGDVERMTGHPAQDFVASPALFLELLDSGDHRDAAERIAAAPVGEPIRLGSRPLGTGVGEVHLMVARKVRRPDGSLVLAGTVVDGDAGPAGLAEGVLDPWAQAWTLQQLGEFMSVSGTDGTTRWVSPSIETVLGWTPEQVIGRMPEFVHPEDLDTVATLMGEATAAPGGVRHRARLATAAGSYRWCELTTIAVRDEAGTVVEFRGISRDVHEQVLAEQALAESERNYRLLAENAGDVVYLTDEDAVIRWVSPSVTAVLGYPPQDFLGVNILDLTHPEDSPDLRISGDHVVASDPHAVVREIRYRTADGRWQWMSMRARPLRDDTTGTVIGGIVTLQDATATREHREQLAASEQLYRLLAQNSSDTVILNRDGHTVWVSPALTRMLGWAPEDWIGHPQDEFLHPDDVRGMHAASEELHRAGKGDYRVQVRDSRGLYHWVEVHGSVFINADGNPDGVVSSFRVVDDQIATEDELTRRARSDDLTGLLNRGEILGQLHAALTHPPRQGSRLAIAFCDIDDFKTINDHYGHGAGDEALRVLAARTRAVVRSADLVARFGGDELLVVLDGVSDLADALNVAEKIRRQAHLPVPVLGGHFSFTLSIGVTLAAPGEDLDRLIARADDAMYRAKANGKDQVIAVPDP